MYDPGVILKDLASFSTVELRLLAAELDMTVRSRRMQAAIRRHANNKRGGNATPIKLARVAALIEQAAGFVHTKHYGSVDIILDAVEAIQGSDLEE